MYICKVKWRCSTKLEQSSWNGTESMVGTFQLGTVVNGFDSDLHRDLSRSVLIHHLSNIEIDGSSISFSFFMYKLSPDYMFYVGNITIAWIDCI